MIEGKEKEILKLNDFCNIRMWREIKNLDTKCKIIRDKFIIDKERKDVSVIKFKFKYREKDFYCIQDKEKRNVFYVGNNEEYLKKDMTKFTVGEDLYSFINEKWIL
jgi:Zn-dependent peptidase ImmA (M78 family)